MQAHRLVSSAFLLLSFVLLSATADVKSSATTANTTTAKPCSTPILVVTKNATILPKSDSLFTYYQCKDGHQPIKNTMSICFNGKWSDFAGCRPNCLPQTDANGSCKLANNGVQANCTCKQSDYLSNNNSVKCTNGVWSQIPKCTPPPVEVFPCSEPPTVPNGRCILPLEAKKAKKNARALCQCNNGNYTLSGMKKDDDKFAVCGDKGWTYNVDVKCVPRSTLVLNFNAANCTALLPQNMGCNASLTSDGTAIVCGDKTFYIPTNCSGKATLQKPAVPTVERATSGSTTTNNEQTNTLSLNFNVTNCTAILPPNMGCNAASLNSDGTAIVCGDKKFYIPTNCTRKTTLQGPFNTASSTATSGNNVVSTSGSTTNQLTSTPLLNFFVANCTALLPPNPGCNASLNSDGSAVVCGDKKFYIPTNCTGKTIIQGGPPPSTTSGTASGLTSGNNVAGTSGSTTTNNEQTNTLSLNFNVNNCTALLPPNLGCNASLNSDGTAIVCGDKKFYIPTNCTRKTTIQGGPPPSTTSGAASGSPTVLNSTLILNFFNCTASLPTNLNCNLGFTSDGSGIVCGDKKFYIPPECIGKTQLLGNPQPANSSAPPSANNTASLATSTVALSSSSNSFNVTVFPNCTAFVPSVLAACTIYPNGTLINGTTRVQIQVPSNCTRFTIVVLPPPQPVNINILPNCTALVPSNLAYATVLSNGTVISGDIRATATVPSAYTVTCSKVTLVVAPPPPTNTNSPTTAGSNGKK